MLFVYDQIKKSSRTLLSLLLIKVIADIVDNINDNVRNIRDNVVYIIDIVANSFLKQEKTKTYYTYLKNNVLCIHVCSLLGYKLISNYTKTVNR